MKSILFRPRSAGVALVLAALALAVGGTAAVGLPSRQMRELPGGEQAANALFNRLTAGAADVTPPSFPGVARKRSDGVTITYLLPVKGGAPPTILVEAPKLPISELQFPPNPGRDGGSEG